MKTKKNHKNFIMDTDWIFQGILDSEQKEYVLLNYFQKLNEHLEAMKVYPMFIELSLHLGNIQTLLTRNQMLYTDKKFTSPDDEIVISDLKVKDIPQMNDEEFDEYRKILKYSQPKLFDYFNIAKSIWSIVYDSITTTIKKNKKNIGSKSGFFYYKTGENILVLKYTTRRVKNTKNQTRTSLKEIYNGPQNNLTIQEIISKFSLTYEKGKENEFPIIEVNCSQIFPLQETLIPIFKRKVLALIAQSKKVKIDTDISIY